MTQDVHPRRRVQRDHRHGLQVRPVHAGPPRLPQAGLHRLHRGGPRRGPGRGRASSSPPRWSWAARAPTSTSTTASGTWLMDGLQLGILFNQGQVCCAGSRVFVQEGIYDKFVAAAVDAFQKVKVGDALGPRHPDGLPDQRGTAAQDPRLHRHRQAGRGARSPAAASAPIPRESCAKGSFMQPTLIDQRAPTICGWPRRKFSGLWPWSSSSRPRRRSSPWPTTSVYGLGGAVWTRDHQPGHPGVPWRGDRAHVGKHL